LKLDVRSARGAGKVCPGVEARTLQMAAGSISSLLFVTGNIPMLLKAYRTRDLRSYSLSNILLVNVGNLLYWFYVSSLPFGPVWLLHSFYTVTMVVLLVWYLRYQATINAARPGTAGGYDAQDR
jgi:uncharacterized protein with PQ loop repeat